MGLSLYPAFHYDNFQMNKSQKCTVNTYVPTTEILLRLLSYCSICFGLFFLTHLSVDQLFLNSTLLWIYHEPRENMGLDVSPHCGAQRLLITRVYPCTDGRHSQHPREANKSRTHSWLNLYRDSRGYQGAWRPWPSSEGLTQEGQGQCILISLKRICENHP